MYYVKEYNYITKEVKVFNTDDDKPVKDFSDKYVYGLFTDTEGTRSLVSVIPDINVKLNLVVMYGLTHAAKTSNADIDYEKLGIYLSSLELHTALLLRDNISHSITASFRKVDYDCWRDYDDKIIYTNRELARVLVKRLEGSSIYLDSYCGRLG